MPWVMPSFCATNSLNHWRIASGLGRFLAQKANWTSLAFIQSFLRSAISITLASIGGKACSSLSCP